MSGQPYVSIEGLVRRLITSDGSEQAVVDGVSLGLQQGEVFALLGPSGCGKTSLLRLLAGLDAPTAGRVVLGGRELTGMPAYERPVNMMFQSYALFPHLSVWDNVAFGLRQSALARADVARRVEHLLSLVKLQAFAARKPHQLSGGEQQRVALARSLARQPRLLLLDEPLGALDRSLRETTQAEVLGIIRNVGVTCLMVTHDPHEAMAMADRIGVMHEGRLQQVGTPREVYERPVSRLVAGLLGEVNVFRPMPPLGRDAAEVMLRPEHIRLSRLPGPATVGSQGEAVHQVQGTVRERVYQGNSTRVVLDVSDGSLLQIRLSADEAGALDAPQPGERAHAWWPASAALSVVN